MTARHLRWRTRDLTSCTIYSTLSLNNEGNVAKMQLCKCACGCVRGRYLCVPPSHPSPPPPPSPPRIDLPHCHPNAVSTSPAASHPPSLAVTSSVLPMFPCFPPPQPPHSLDLGSLARCGGPPSASFATLPHRPRPAPCSCGALPTCGGHHAHPSFVPCKPQGCLQRRDTGAACRLSRAD